MIDVQMKAAGRLRLLLGTALALLIAAPGRTGMADNENTEAGKDKAEAEIVVTGTIDPLNLNQKAEGASRLGLTPLQTPASVETIDGDAIRLRGDRTIQDAAARATGIVNASGVFGYSLTARGFSGQNSVMQLYDGMRMYNNTLTFPSDPWMADRVEVLRGPASVLYGEGAIGGAVNVVRKQPTDDWQTSGRLMAASFNTRSIGLGTGGPISDKIGIRLDGSYARSDGWMIRGYSNSLAVSGSLRLKPTDTLTVTLSNDFSRQRPRTWFGVPLVAGKLDRSLRRNNYDVLDARLRFRDDWSQAKIQWAPSDVFSIQSDTYHLFANKYWHNDENMTYVAATATAPAQIRQSSFLELFHVQKQTGNRTTASLNSPILGLENHVLVGFDVNHITYKNISNSGNNATRLVALNPGNDTGYFIDQTGLAATQPRYTNTINQYAVFAEDRLVLAPRFSIVTGIRYDRPKIRKRDYIVAANNYIATPDAVTWRAGAVYNPIPNLALYAQYATAADPVGALVSTSRAQSAFDLSTGRQWEGGIKHAFWNGRGEWTFAAYDIVKKKLLTSDPLIPTLQVQVGQQSSKGLEASLFLKPVKRVSGAATSVSDAGSSPVARRGSHPAAAACAGGTRR